jgi:3-dehydroquinate synthase
MAAELSQQCGLLDGQAVRRIKDLLSRLNLPIQAEFDPGAVFEALGKDKKRQGHKIKFVLLESIGNARIQDFAIGELGRWLVPS